MFAAATDPAPQAKVWIGLEIGRTVFVETVLRKSTAPAFGARGNVHVEERP